MIRAIDVGHDLTTLAFTSSLKRFIVRRGLTEKFLSDNGKTFKAAAKTVDDIMKDTEVQQYLSGMGVELQFNLESAP